MPRRTITVALTAVVVGVFSAPAPAIDFGFGWFKRRRSNEQQPQKTEASLQVKQLLATLQSDPNVDRRKVAAVELKKHDPRNNADILTTLVGALQKDPSPDVRALAAETIGEYRTVSQSAAAALEAVEHNDPDKNVRDAAKAALWQYGLNGYKPTASLPTRTQTAEPPLARPLVQPPPLTTVARPTTTTTEVQFRPITQGPVKSPVSRQTTEPPLARPLPTSTVTPPPGVPQQMPSKLEVPVDPNPTLPVPLPSIPSVPQVMPSSPPTVNAPGK